MQRREKRTVRCSIREDRTVKTFSREAGPLGSQRMQWPLGSAKIATSITILIPAMIIRSADITLRSSGRILYMWVALVLRAPTVTLSSSAATIPPAMLWARKPTEH
eukprot:TRINITY_DN23547_c0_g1_i2.p2 TRINITY_DN23547_c0_g1~~TRINITY_DN23547_c0_g1_i2.p2  ORF type:complete len:106 (+),score=0.83 TRINITY_DN23547_c0_g1_i2:270-587(+)